MGPKFYTRVRYDLPLGCRAELIFSFPREEDRIIIPDLYHAFLPTHPDTYLGQVILHAALVNRLNRCPLKLVGFKSLTDKMIRKYVISVAETMYLEREGGFVYV